MPTGAVFGAAIAVIGKGSNGGGGGEKDLGGYTGSEPRIFIREGRYGIKGVRGM